VRFFSKCEVIKQEEITSKPIGLLAPEAMNLIPLPPVSRALFFIRIFSWGSRPRLYAIAVSRASVFATVDDVEI